MKINCSKVTGNNGGLFQISLLFSLNRAFGFDFHSGQKTRYKLLGQLMLMKPNIIHEIFQNFTVQLNEGKIGNKDMEVNTNL